MSQEIRTSPRHIGFLATGEGCERCAWWLHEVHNHPPFEKPMPGLMFAADHSEKAVFDEWVRKHSIPSTLEPYNDVVELIPPCSYKKFTAYHPSGLWLHGIYDALGVRKNGTLAVLDHKSARYKGKDDPFMPQYEIQLTGYSWIAETLHKKEVTGTALIYWEAQPHAVEEDPMKYAKGSTIMLPLVPKVHEIERDYKLLGKLAKTFKQIVTSKIPPEGRTGCKNCAALEHICEVHARLLREADKAMRDAAYRFDPVLISMRNLLLRDLHKARFSGLEGWMNLDPEEAELGPDGWISSDPKETEDTLGDRV